MNAKHIIGGVIKQCRRTLVKIAGRPKLPGSRGEGFPAYLKEASTNYPHRILAQDYGVKADTSPEDCAKAVRYFIEIHLMCPVLYTG